MDTIQNCEIIAECKYLARTKQWINLGIEIPSMYYSLYKLLQSTRTQNLLMYITGRKIEKLMINE